MDIFLIELSGAKVALKKEMYFQSKKLNKETTISHSNQSNKENTWLKLF